MEKSWEEKVPYRCCHTRRASDARQRPTQLSTAKNEGLLHSGKRDERRRPQPVYEFLPKRDYRRGKGASLHQREPCGNSCIAKEKVCHKP
jgi:hypothetical protein